jgi:predicted transcriptional regulator
MASTVRISESSHQALRELADGEHVPLQTVLERAIENYRRQRFLEAANRQYAALRADAEAWSVEQDERSAWEPVVSDGLNE